MKKSAVSAKSAKKAKLRVVSRRAKLPARKVANLKLVKGKKKARGLSAAQQEEIVLTHRLKARKLARSILRRWHSRLDIQEVDSIVDLSLCEAVRRYDPKYGASFITFLFYHMRGNLIRAVSSAANQNMVPVDHSEIELASGETENGFERIAANAVEIAHALSSSDFPRPDEMLFQKERTALSSGACSRLDPLEREVIERIFIKEEQLIDVAKELGYSRCHISRVKRKALDELYSKLSGPLQLERSAGCAENDDVVQGEDTAPAIRRALAEIANDDERESVVA